MRVLLLTAVAAAALTVVACSGGSEDALRRSQDLTTTQAQPTTESNSTGESSTTSTTPPASPPDSDASPATPEGGATPDGGGAGTPAPGTCATPKCFGFGGFGGCKATDSAGASVVLACDNGGCACLTAGTTTSTFAGDVNSGDDAAQLFLANCDCL